MLLQAIPEGRCERRGLASDLIEHWIRPIGKSDRVSSDRLDAAEDRLGFRLPIALREWYERLGDQGVLDLERPVVVSPSMSGRFALPLVDQLRWITAPVLAVWVGYPSPLRARPFAASRQFRFARGR